MVDTRFARLIAAIGQAAAILIVMFEHERTAFRALFLQRLVPGRVIALRIILAAVELSASMRLALDNRPTAFGALHASIHKQWHCIAAVRESGAGQELAETPLLDHHHAATFVAGNIRFFFRQFHMPNGFIRLFQSHGKGVIKFFEQVIFFHLAFGDFIQLIFEVCRKLHIDNVLEVLFQHIHHHKAQFRGLEMLVNALDIAAGLNRLNNRRIGTRTANFLFLQSLNERSIVVTWRRFREVLLWQHLSDIQFITLG